MTDVKTEITPEFLEAFTDAWNRHDIDALMSFMTDDCVFEGAGGPDVYGTRIEANGCDLFTFRNGKIAVKNAFRKDRPRLGPSER